MELVWQLSSHFAVTVCTVLCWIQLSSVFKMLQPSRVYASPRYVFTLDYGSAFFCDDDMGAGIGALLGGTAGLVGGILVGRAIANAGNDSGSPKGYEFECEGNC